MCVSIYMKANPSKMCGGKVGYRRTGIIEGDIDLARGSRGGFVAGEGELGKKSRLQNITNRLESLAKKNKPKPKNITF
jgi:hypothetical protein